MQQTYNVTLLKFIQREWEGRKYYSCRVLTEDFEVLDLNVKSSLVEDKPNIVTLKEVPGIAHITLVSGQKNKPTFILTDFIPMKK